MTFIEKHIIELLQEKDERAISLIYDQYAAPLYGVILKITRNEAMASDVLQETLIKVWHKSHVYDPEKAKLFTWLFQIARNTALDALRKSKRKSDKEIQIQNRDVYPNEDGIDKEDRDLINAQINRLDKKYREVLETIFFKGMTHMEAADYLNLPLGTLKTRLRNALKELRTINIGLFIIIVSCLL
ncbi:RNA polymerase sigma-70 factor (ECF subfamily) [Nonlabens dokdonensis]|uniref:DNA-directed RNA polymerase, sigma-70 region 2, ECF-type subfamily n=2 Tax=Nonlabens dokdonensis TaxID=328515 RepID=L7W671_NONDD|nr:sigma-70 family RNA polymerase sigma factor [Nonlabens dokdonensis]AGC75624.1 DNA-directed RNA polymerase, sigma-70 region 2, ECF-type subfamily [Nonlabens dokdonensis DSW-6]PZX43316.1 RNA polymerase sigma-70 factor (ECF subfamily) [Nonlabens dokdonensis]